MALTCYSRLGLTRVREATGRRSHVCAAEPQRQWGAWAKRKPKQPSENQISPLPRTAPSPSGEAGAPSDTAPTDRAAKPLRPAHPDDAPALAQQLADHLRAAGAPGNCLVSSAILMDLLQARGLQGELQQGFMLMNERVGLWHVWVTCGGHELDVAWLSQEPLLETKPWKRELVRELPPDAARIDRETEGEKMVLQHNEAMWAQIQERGLEAAYWPSAPAQARQLRSEMGKACSG